MRIARQVGAFSIDRRRVTPFSDSRVQATSERTSNERLRVQVPATEQSDMDHVSNANHVHVTKHSARDEARLQSLASRLNPSSSQHVHTYRY